MNWFNRGKVFVKFVKYRFARALFSSFCVAASRIGLQGFARCCALTVPAELIEVPLANSVITRSLILAGRNSSRLQCSWCEKFNAGLWNGRALRRSGWQTNLLASLGARPLPLCGILTLPTSFAQHWFDFPKVKTDQCWRARASDLVIHSPSCGLPINAVENSIDCSHRSGTGFLHIPTDSNSNCQKLSNCQATTCRSKMVSAGPVGRSVRGLR